MKLAFKVILAMVLGMLIVLAVFGWIRARNEIAVYDADMRKDHRLIATTLGVSVASTWASDRPEQALELIRRADAERPGLRIGWLFTDGRQFANAPLFEGLHGSLSEIQHTVQRAPDGSPHDYLVTRVPVREHQTLLGAIEIAESLESRNESIRSSILNTVLATATVLVTSGVIALVLGVWLVGGPLRQLAAKAKRIGQGDWGGPLALRQRDEIGELAAEMNAMCERLAEAHARTEAETASRIQTLEQLRHADRLITVGRLAAGVAHELGTPLNVIAGRVKMLRRPVLEPSVREDYLAAVAEQVERMTKIIRQLMDFARRREPKVSTFDLESIAGSISRLMAPIARKQGVELRVLSAERVQALGDPAQLEQVLSNLVVNAVHASSEGAHVDISCGVETVEGARRAVLRVEDRGHGMDEATVARIFEPFFTTKAVGQGTGLGLSVAHGIVSDHGGSIVVRSQRGIGSVFSVLLPMTAP